MFSYKIFFCSLLIAWSSTTHGAATKTLTPTTKSSRILLIGSVSVAAAFVAVNLYLEWRLATGPNWVREINKRGWDFNNNDAYRKLLTVTQCAPAWRLLKEPYTKQDNTSIEVQNPQNKTESCTITVSTIEYNRWQVIYKWKAIAN